MPVVFEKCAEDGTSFFLLNTPNSSYIITVLKNRIVSHSGWGRRIEKWSGNAAIWKTDRGVNLPPDLDPRNLSLDTLPQEYGAPGKSDFRPSSIDVAFKDGSRALDLRYFSHNLIEGKPQIKGLPATYALEGTEVQTLALTLKDTVFDVYVTLFYAVWAERDIICRWAEVENKTQDKIKLEKVMSACIDFACSDFRMFQLSGSWGREHKAYIRELVPGTQSIESRRGSSSHHQNPFVALLAKDASEDSGEVFGFNFVYSGNFEARVDVDFVEAARFSMGINSYNFGWNLEAGASFAAPEVVMVYSKDGLGQMSRTFHDLYRERLCRGEWQLKPRPIVINNWEATYFDFDEKKLCALADAAKEAGVEMFVLDDGWFGNRFDDRRALGDWVVNTQKLKGGLPYIVSEMKKRGLGFGLWVEPEMVSPESELFKAHPDWCIHIPGREMYLARTQLMLDLSRQDVVDYLFETLSDIFASAEISYIKWDFNRYMTDVFSEKLDAEHQQEMPHRYVLGLYSLLERLTAKFPHILFESCASGGGRFDPGILYYMPQIWTSDNTDALSRITIQAGTAVVYPPSAMSCHVSAVPNHQTGRITPLAQRAFTAMAGTYGYELDMTKLAKDEIAQIAEYSALYKKIRSVVQFGDCYRLVSPWEKSGRIEKYAAWINVSKDKSHAVVTISWIYAEAYAPKIVLKLKGLDENADYKDLKSGNVYSAKELMYFGLILANMWGGNASEQVLLEKI